MWRVNITCSGDAWKLKATEFKTLADKYQGDSISSKKMPDGTRIMAYKIEDVNDAEALQEECGNFPGFTSDFESL
jgi:predicted secreted hydrolase